MPRGGCRPSGDCREPCRAAALGSCAGCSWCWPGGGATGPVGAGPGRGVGPRGRCGRAEVAQPAALSTCAQRGTQRRARGAWRPQVSGPGRAAGHLGLVGAEGRGGSAARVGSGGAVPHSHPRSATRSGRARSSSAQGSRARRACWSALRWGVPALPTHHFKLWVLWKLPGGFSGGVHRNEACGENPHSRGFACFQFVLVWWKKDEGCSSAPAPSLRDPPLEGPAPRLLQGFLSQAVAA